MFTTLCTLKRTLNPLHAKMFWIMHAVLPTPSEPSGFWGLILIRNPGAGEVFEPNTTKRPHPYPFPYFVSDKIETTKSPHHIGAGLMSRSLICLPVVSRPNR